MYRYEYDVNGNITQIKDAAGVIQYQYTYDSLGQLIREDNRPMNATYTWTYDDAGNIQYKTTYNFTTGSSLGSVLDSTYYSYEFDSGWDDWLLLYDGLPITYDEIGNPYRIVIDQYRGGNGIWEDYGYEYVWNGRQLMGRRYYDDYCGDVWYDEYYDIWFEYNADGIRTSKTVYDLEYKYILNGSQIIGETWTEYGTEYLLLYIYDETGSPIGIQYRTSAYAADTYDCFFFEKNLQGDIVAIYNTSGEKIGSYIYDAWGNFRTTTVSGNTALENQIVTQYNPFRYRGYYYDKDLGWYYLQTRYYNPQWGRFVNADGYVSTGTGLLGYNMFAYCNNNPVMNVDPTGDFPWWNVVIIVTAVVAVVDFSLFLAGPSKEEHYSRNENNIVPDEEEFQKIVEGKSETWEAADDKFNRYHRFTCGTQGEEAIYNKKYMTKDETSEVIICFPPDKEPYIVNDPVNIGTYNYGPGQGFDHLIKDVVPYYRWGNSEEDTTKWLERIIGR